MILGIPTGELLLLASACIAGGVVTGVLAGLFGVGGGAIIVPVLYEIFRVLKVPEDIRMQLCIGTSLAVIVPTSIGSFRAHRARGTLPLEVLRIWIVPVVAGVALGGVIAAFAPGWIFKLAFVAFGTLVAGNMFLRKESWKISDQLPAAPLMAFFGFSIGLFSSLMGIGGGALVNIVLTLYGVTMHAAVGIASGVGVIISLAGTIGYVLAGWPQTGRLPPLSLGFVSLIGLVLMAPIATLAAPLGARLAHALPKRQLEIGFGIFLLLVAARFLVSLLT